MPSFLSKIPAGLGVLASAVLLLVCSRPEPPTPQDGVRRQFLTDLDSLTTLTRDRLLPLAEHGTDADSLRSTFLACRRAYKRIEHFTEYLFPTTTRLVNGPPLPEFELEENKMFEPSGLQVIEEYLYPAVATAEYDLVKRAELVREVRKLLNELLRYRELWDATDFTDAHVFDALRLQVFRINTLGISGFDTPACQTAVPEAAESLAALGRVLVFYEAAQATRGKSDSLRARLTAAERYLRQPVSFDHFDRMRFLTEFANPLSTQLLTYQRAIGIEPFDEVRPLRPDAPTLFAVGAFNPDFYAPYADSRSTPAKVALGQRLFYDPVLSKSRQRSCASCHQPDKAFTDGLVKSAALLKGELPRNAPTLLNAALQNGLFYDLRAENLEGQSKTVVENRDEMHGSLADAARRLSRDADYAAQFRRAFPKAKAIGEEQILNALASYERSLLSFDSPFDRYVRGEQTALNRSEINGFNLFMGKAKCGICHFTPLFNGTVPPDFTKTESEVIGVPATPTGTRIDPDPGRGQFYEFEEMRYAFKTPTVRNVALTAPYMHNGVYRTLEEVVAFYDRGGGTGLGFNLPYQTLPGDRLHLTAGEKQDLVAFMKALTDVSAAKPPQATPPKERLMARAIRR